MLRIIGTFIIIYIFFRIITGIIVPWLLRRHLNRYKKKYYERSKSASEQSGHYRKGDVHIKMDSSKKTHDSDSIGEYVDFEDIKEDKKDEE